MYTECVCVCVCTIAELPKTKQCTSGSYAWHLAYAAKIKIQYGFRWIVNALESQMVLLSNGWNIYLTVWAHQRDFFFVFVGEWPSDKKKMTLKIYTINEWNRYGNRISMYPCLWYRYRYVLVQTMELDLFHHLIVRDTFYIIVQWK